MITGLVTLIFPIAMIAVAVSDIFTMRIPNWMTIALAVSFFPVALLAGFSWDMIGWHTLAGIIALAITMLLFSLRQIGGGDAKLVSATVLWLGWPLSATYLVYSAICGGVLTLAILGFRRLSLSERLATIGWVERLHNPKIGVPYGIALAIGGLITFVQSPLMIV